MGVIECSEPNGAKFLEGYPHMKQQLQQAQWLEFVEKFDGQKKKVTESFSSAYEDIEAEIGDAKLVLTESFVVESIRLLKIRKSWFKNKKIKEKYWEIFL